MSDFLIAVGKRMHLIAESENGVIASSPAAATNFPATHLHDGIPSVPFRHNAIAANNNVDADLNLAINGDFEHWDGATPDAPEGWTLEGSTTVDKETTDEIAGAASIVVDGAIYRDFEVPSGSLVAFRIRMAEFGSSTANAIVQVIDMITGEWLMPAGTWTASATSLFVESNEYSSSGDERVKGLVFTARPYSTVGEDVTILRVRLICGGEDDGDEAIFDDVSLVPVPNFMSVHGHNVAKKHDPQLRSSGSSPPFTQDSQMLARMGIDSFTTQESRVIGIRRQPSFYYQLKDNCPFLDGSADAFELTSPAAMSDSLKFTLSGWIRKDGQDSADGFVLVLWDNGNSRKVLEVKCNTTNGITVIGRNASGTTVLSHTTAAELIPPDTNWHHVLVSVDLTLASIAIRSKIRIDGVDAGSASTATKDAQFDFSAVTKIAVGGDISGGTVSPDLQAALNELYFQPAFSENIDTQANREKFRNDGNGARTALGSDGSIPSSGQAYLYLRGTMTNPVSDFGSNFGSGGAFATLGAPGSETMFATQRYWRLAVDALAAAPADVPTKAIELGQWVLTRTEKLIKMQRLPYSASRTRPHVEHRSPSGDILRVAMSYADVRGYTFLFQNDEAARDSWAGLRDRSGGGTRVAVIVPDTDGPDVHLGFLSVDHPEERQLVQLFPVTVEFEELPFAESLVT